MRPNVRLRKVCLAVCFGLLACGAEEPERLPDPPESPASDSTPSPAAQAQTGLRPAPSARRRALLVGINDYSSASRIAPAAGGRKGEGRGVLDLEGAVNDVRAVKEMLVLYGFAPKDILLLTDQAATRAAILRAIEEHLEKPSGAGDVALFYFSGHGSQAVNSGSDEPDHLDETLVPADSLQGKPDIRDKELRPLFNRILDRGVHLTIVLDNCHSGSGARGLPVGARFRSVDPDRRDVKDGTPAGPRPEDRGALVFSAAQDYDLAWEGYDEQGQPHGAFSLALVQAMRDSVAGEPAEETFLRARARLQAEKRFQEPVLAGIAEARRAPFLGHRTGQRAGRTVVAVERVRGDGTVVLQGGWANGLTVGSELRLLPPGPEARIEVTAVHGFSRSEARLLPPTKRSAPVTLEPGMLAEVVRWTAHPGAPLRVWIPKIARSVDAAVALARELARQAPRKRIRWITDPTRQTATHVLRWNGQGWELLASKGAVERLGPAPDASAVLARIPTGEDATLFVQLPAPPALVSAIKVGPGTDHSAVEITDRPEDADYVLVGRLSAGSLEYAWMRPGAGETDQRRTSLPVRTDWHSLEARDKLATDVLQLRKIHAWLHLETPPGTAFPYELALCKERSKKGAECSERITDAILVGQERYCLRLRAKEAQRPARVEPRYVYVFLVDSHGRSILLFPPSGSVENRIPVPSVPGKLPMEIPLGRSAAFQVTEPYGADIYFLLTTDELIPNPWVLQSDGVRTRGPRGSTPLEELLSITGGTVRSVTPISTPAAWSVERKLFESVPPRLAQAR